MTKKILFIVVHLLFVVIFFSPQLLFILPQGRGGDLNDIDKSLISVLFFDTNGEKGDLAASC